MKMEGDFIQGITFGARMRSYPLPLPTARLHVDLKYIKTKEISCFYAGKFCVILLKDVRNSYMSSVDSR